MQQWQTLSTEEVYKTAWITVRRDKVLNHNNLPLTYSVVKLNHPSVVIIALNTTGHILLQKNYRYTIDRIMWELPAGHSDGENLLMAAKRELHEETGLVSDDWTDLGCLYQATGVGNMPLQVFLARNTIASQDYEGDKNEHIEHQHFFDQKHIEAMITSGEFINAMVLGALYLAKAKGF